MRYSLRRWPAGHTGIWLIGVLVAGITAYYTFRMIFVVFHGSPRDQKAHANATEPPRVMTWPLIVLAVGALAAGFLNLPALFGGDQIISHWLAPSVADHHPHAGLSVELVAVGASVIAFVIGIAIAYRKFGTEACEPEYRGLTNFAYHKFYVDELYHALIVAPYQFAGKAIGRVIEPYVTDAPVKLASWLYLLLSRAFTIFQAGYVRIYAIYMVIGLSIMSMLLANSIN